ncbi:Uu.00g090650.m01.CDS01 [Anthostomella pinea]|uniref:Uu.00g090650.m01.CDS01 n=1 Tax=Anthostomella pinea TaxID=933095 RepID=A0AAI8VMZ3_9PEZI|nr:Uu.00g090650.m01.CDS01 [Anthostomella pinea]
MSFSWRSGRTLPPEQAVIFSQKASPSASGKMQLRHAMWVWNTAQLLTDTPQVDRLVSAAGPPVNLTDIYLYVAPGWWEEKGASIADLNTRLHGADIRVWALDGDVAYIDNTTAQATFLQSLRDLGGFNERVPPAARFHGFQADIEPQDTSDHHGYFMNGMAESKLAAPQRTSRDDHLRNWLAILTQTSNLTRSYGLEVGAALPFWLHDYEGETLTVSVPSPNGTQRTSVMELIMPLLDEYVVMSYNTIPTTAANFVSEQAKYASDQARNGSVKMTRVLGAVETAKGIGQGVSYGDTPGKDSRTAVLEDTNTIESGLARYSAFGGLAIHHWAAWEALAP